MAEQGAKYLVTQDFVAILTRFAELVAENTNELCKLDSQFGDGDHGTTMKRGTNAAQQKIRTSHPEQIDKLLSGYAMAMLGSMGGASGPIFSSLFQGMSVAATGQTKLDTKGVVSIFEQALEKVTRVGKAAEGDKTLVDSLAPAVRAARAELENGGDLSKILASAHKAALEGVINTRDMVAKKGRARYAGERSLGHEDAGAVTISLMFQAFSDHLNKRGQHA